MEIRRFRDKAGKEFAINCDLVLSWSASGEVKTRNSDGHMVPIGSVATFRDTTGPFRVARYNLHPAAELQAQLAPGFSTGQGIATIEKIAAD